MYNRQNTLSRHEIGTPVQLSLLLSVINVKMLLGTFYHEKALVTSRGSSMIVKTGGSFAALLWCLEIVSHHAGPDHSQHKEQSSS